MQALTNRQILFMKRPTGVPDENCFKMVTTAVPVPADGQLLVRTMYVSVDPYMRGRMNDRKSYIPPFTLNAPMSGGVVGQVVESKTAAFSIGDIVTGNLGWQDYSVAAGSELTKVDPFTGPISTALGVLGMTGLTAYFGLLVIGRPKPNETIVISAAAGAVGTIVGQIAKIYGCRVVGIAGSDVKTKYLVDELKFDAAVNYRKNDDMKAALAAVCPNGIDIYFDNVGGSISDAVLTLINTNARIAVCGQISLYNEPEDQVGPRVQHLLLTRSALMKGFLIGNYIDRFEEGRRRLAHWIGENRLKYKENVVEGLENAPKAFLGLFTGENIGKQLVKVS